MAGMAADDAKSKSVREGEEHLTQDQRDTLEIRRRQQKEKEGKSFSSVLPVAGFGN